MVNNTNTKYVCPLLRTLISHARWDVQHVVHWYIWYTLCCLVLCFIVGSIFQYLTVFSVQPPYVCPCQGSGLSAKLIGNTLYKWKKRHGNISYTTDNLRGNWPVLVGFPHKNINAELWIFVVISRINCWKNRSVVDYFGDFNAPVRSLWYGVFCFSSTVVYFTHVL